MATDIGLTVNTLIGNSNHSSKIDLHTYIDTDVGIATLQDILTELDKPGRDPRDNFESVRFREDINSINDLEPGMRLNGIVTNVTQFGAFVDIGVHQDGLVHISELADRYIRDPHDVVQAGQKVAVMTLSIDHKRKRIALSIKQAQKGPITDS